jgi:hypothetical protein
MLRYFVRSDPEILHIDDDFPYHNHRPAAWGCFCPLHLAEISRRLGRPIDRSELSQTHDLCFRHMQHHNERLHTVIF